MFRKNKEKDENRGPFRAVLDIIVTFVIVSILFVIFRYFVRFPLVVGNSMEPTYHDGDRLVVLYTHEADLNDVVVAWSESLNEYVVKRVIGVAGDEIDTKNGAVYRNGVRLYESYLRSQQWKTEDDDSFAVGDGEYFLLGDNREDSIDSRKVGCVKKEDVFGRVIFSFPKNDE